MNENTILFSPEMCRFLIIKEVNFFLKRNKQDLTSIPRYIHEILINP